MKDLKHCKEDDCCSTGTCLAPITSLINHSCFPNASRFFTEDLQAVVYALHPIKKDSQVSYVLENTDFCNEILLLI